MSKMKLLACAVGLTLAAASTASYAAVANSVTVGARGGYAFNQTSGDFTDGSNGFGAGLYVEYNLTSYLGFGLGYNFFDNMDVRYKNTDPVYDFSSSGPEASLRLAYPFDAKGSDIFLRGGAYWGSSDFEEGNNKFTDFEVSPFVGVGVQYAFNEMFSVRAGYDHYFDVFDDEADGFGRGGNTDLGLAYIGFNVTFGGNTPAPAPVAEPQKNVHITSVNFASESLFGFDSAKISDSGLADLSENVDKIKQINAQNLSFEVNGYTDRIGKPEYNQKLSENRAKAVADALVNYGIPQDSITSNGYGSSNSITGDKCDGLTGNALITCLAPDRRVEVKVMGDVVSAQ